MSRSGYSDDCDDCSYLELYRNAVERAIAGKRGQKFLADLAAAMDAMEVKELIAGALEDHGAYCALGVVAVARGVNVVDFNEFYETTRLAKPLDIAESLAREVAYENDEGGDWQETPAQRWTRVREWVADQIKHKQ